MTGEANAAHNDSEMAEALTGFRQGFGLIGSSRFYAAAPTVARERGWDGYG